MFCAVFVAFSRTLWAESSARYFKSSRCAFARACLSSRTTFAVSFALPQVSFAAPLICSAAPLLANFWLPMASPTPCLILPATWSNFPSTFSVFIDNSFMLRRRRATDSACPLVLLSSVGAYPIAEPGSDDSSTGHEIEDEHDDGENQ